MLKTGRNMEINECVMCANFGDPRSRDRKLTHKKHKKTVIFGLKIYQFAYNSKSSWRAQLKFEHNVCAYQCFMETEFGGT